jgi:O-antigen ligase
MSGGRGAFVTMILLGLFVLYIMIKSHRISYVALSSIIVITAGVIILLLIKLNVMETVGFLRISERLTEDPGRLELYNKAWRSIENSYYMGSGLGSVWWEVGFYSHNMFLDMLVEIGII